MSQKLQRQSGQIALIVLLIMGITLVIAVSLAQRTTEDVALTTKQAETTKVFSAAQSGAEQVLTEVLIALRRGVPVSTGPQTTVVGTNDSEVEVTVDEASEFVQPLDEGETYQVSLTDPSTTDVVIEWGDANSNCVNEASLLIARYNTSGGATSVSYSGYYPIGSGCSGAGTDGFAPAPYGGTAPRRNYYMYTKQAGDQFLRIMPVYNSTNLFVSGAGAQQYAITANAQNLLGEDAESRVIQVTTSDLQPPPFLDYAIFSGTTINKP